MQVQWTACPSYQILRSARIAHPRREKGVRSIPSNVDENIEYHQAGSTFGNTFAETKRSSRMSHWLTFETVSVELAFSAYPKFTIGHHRSP